MSVGDAAAIWRLNHRLLTRALNDCDARFGELGLEAKEFFVLAEIDRCRYPAVIAAALATPKASVTAYLKTLEAAGFVRREIDEADLRRHRLVLTSRGKSVLTKALAALSTAFDHTLSALDSAERAQFERLLRTLLDEPASPGTREVH